MNNVIDSQQATVGATFFALKGEKVDGHDFLQEVARSGGAEAVVHEGYSGPDFGLKLVFVPDVKKELQRRAREKRNKLKARVVGITGSVGKTTTKEFAATLLQGAFAVDKSFGSYNSQLTLPLTILNCDVDAEILILEMGMSESGELLRLTEIAQPEIVIITKIAYSHSAFFESIEGIARAKAEILQSPRLKAVIMHEELRKFAPFAEVEAIYPDDIPIDLPFDATHLRENFALANGLARYLGVPSSQVEKEAKNLSPFTRRFERIKLGGICFINDTYNANPASVEAALKNLPKGDRRIAVLGDMRELGKFSKKCHEDVGIVAGQQVDLLFTLGKEAKEIAKAFAVSNKPVYHFSKKEELAKELERTLRSGDVVLVKGSNSLQMWTLLDHLSTAMA